jgi:hypothetical protein
MSCPAAGGDCQASADASWGADRHAGLTAHLLARGTGPFRMHNVMTVITEAEIRGHRLAAEIKQAWTGRADKTETRAIMGRNQ